MNTLIASMKNGFQVTISKSDFQDTGESPRDPLLQRAAHVRLAFFAAEYEYIYQNLP